MTFAEDARSPDDDFYVLVTGANSGLGLGICLRLVDEFLQTRPLSETLVLIFTTRSPAKGDATLSSLQAHLSNTCRQLERERKISGLAAVLRNRVQFRSEQLDLLSLLSVQRLAKRLKETIPRLDSAIFNAGIGGWYGLDWPLAVRTVFTGWLNATTWPTYKLARAGQIAKPQLQGSHVKDAKKEDEEPVMGEVFCANVFGHYMLGHYLVPLLARQATADEHGTRAAGRLIWVSSLEAHGHIFSIDDMQGLTCDIPYEVSKRLTDLISMTWTLPGTARFVDAYLSTSDGRPVTDAKTGAAPGSMVTTRPRIYNAHPGICSTSITGLHIIIEYIMLFIFFCSRWFGSPWHTVTPYKGATAMVWLALAKQSTLDAMERVEGPGKWGSATNMWGHERVDRTEVDGWGWGDDDAAVLGVRKGRSPYAKDVKDGDRRDFEHLGARCWAECERLRLDWEQRLAEAGVAVKLD